MDSNLKAKLEALLFVLAEPVSAKKLSQILDLGEPDIRDALSGLGEDFKNEGRGLWLTEINGEFQLTTKPKFGNLLQEVMKAELTEDLTPSSLETLTIVAYLGPVSRAMVEYIRGVNSSFIMRSLLLRDLIQRMEEKKANAFLYDVSLDFLKHLGLSSKKELPDYEKYEAMMKALNNETV